jgi:adenine-specific DNA-methyltransferase
MSLSLTRGRQLRRDATEAESRLWSALRDRRLAGFKFRRQHPIGPFVVDFFCPERRLAVELDGGQLFEDAGRPYDERRTRFLARRRIVVVRFTNAQARFEPDAVLETIFALLKALARPASSTPLRPARVTEIPDLTAW